MSLFEKLQQTQRDIDEKAKKTKLEIVPPLEPEIAGRPDVQLLNAQNKITGRPNVESLDAKTPKTPIWTPKENTNLDAKTPKNSSLDVQKKQESKKWVKYEEHRTTDRLSLRPNAEILKKIKVYCAENDFTLTEFFELAALRLIDLDVQKKNNLGAKTPYDDRRIDYLFKTDARIIHLFLEYQKTFHSKTKWKTKDDAVGVKYNDVDLRVIELGIIQTQTNILQSESENIEPPETFKYYAREIDKMISVGVPKYSDAMLNEILKSNRNGWKILTGKEIDLSFLNKE